MNTTNITIGLDLGDRRHAAYIVDATGERVAEELVPNTRECLEQFSQRYPHAVVALETGTHSPWISRLFAAGGHRVYIANARKVRAISHSVTKSDWADAQLLARLARVDPKLLSPVTHRSEAAQRVLVSLKVRDTLVRSRVSQTNSLRFLLKSLGVILPAGVKATAFVRKTRAALDPATCTLVEPLLKTLETLNTQIAGLDQQLEKLAEERYPETAHLRQVDGVGPLTALCFVLTVESPERFRHARDVGGYLGLVPRRDQSGLSDKQLPITKAGNTQMRCLLVNCAHYILGPFGPPSHLREVGLRLSQRGGAAAKKRAVIAVARKLAVLLLAMWKSGAAYRPQPTANNFSRGLVPATAL